MDHSLRFVKETVLLVTGPATAKQAVNGGLDTPASVRKCCNAALKEGNFHSYNFFERSIFLVAYQRMKNMKWNILNKHLSTL